jgi:hypothetical protein
MCIRSTSGRLRHSLRPRQGSVQRWPQLRVKLASDSGRMHRRCQLTSGTKQPRRATISSVKLLPQRRSIWSHAARYARIFKSLNPEQRASVNRLAGINAAKLNVAPVDPNFLLAISKAIRRMPRCDRVTPGHLVDYFQSCNGHGAGIKTLVCMLAVESKGAYAPMDNKFASGLRRRAVIDAKKEKILNGSNIVEFASVYVSIVMPIWRKTRKKMSGSKADRYWCST